MAWRLSDLRRGLPGPKLIKDDSDCVVPDVTRDDATELLVGWPHGSNKVC